MKQRKSLGGRIKKWNKKHQETIRRVLFGGALIALFVTGYFVSDMFLISKPSDSDFEYYEEVARDVYEQGDKVIYEVPDGIKLERTGTSIIVASSEGRCKGKVVATLHNGELVFEHDMESADTVFLNVLIGVILDALLILIWLMLESLREASRNA